MAQIVTITNPLTGQPAQVDQLDHTAQHIDDAIARALPGGAIDVALQNKADTSSVYTKTESDTLLATKVNGGKKASWVVDSSSFSRNGVSYCRDDAGTVYVTTFNSLLTDEISTWSSKVICTLPEGFRPTRQMAVPLRHSYNKCATISIGTSGQLTVSTGGDSVLNTSDIAFFISFPTV